LSALDLIAPSGLDSGLGLCLGQDDVADSVSITDKASFVDVKLSTVPMLFDSASREPWVDMDSNDEVEARDADELSKDRREPTICFALDRRSVQETESCPGRSQSLFLVAALVEGDGGRSSGARSVLSKAVAASCLVGENSFKKDCTFLTFSLFTVMGVFPGDDGGAVVSSNFESELAVDSLSVGCISFKKVRALTSFARFFSNVTLSFPCGEIKGAVKAGGES
jgi:hypothetical protein